MKIKIFQMVISKNMREWSLNHKKKFSKSMYFLSQYHSNLIDEKGHNHITRPRLPFICIDEEMGIWEEDIGFVFKHKPLCERKISTIKREGIQEVHINSTHAIICNESLSKRMWSNDTNKYWYHVKCRCKDCDMVRVHGYQSLDRYGKHKYSHIKWNWYDDQWETKSPKQIKYEKEKDRSEYRKILKTIKEQNLMENEYRKYILRHKFNI